MSGKNVYDLHRALFGLYNLRTIFNEKVLQLLEINCVPDWWNVKCPERKVPGENKHLLLYILKNQYIFEFLIDLSFVFYRFSNL